MIRATVNRKQRPVLTSDRWHVVHASLSTDASAAAAGAPRFVRSIVSEHEDRALARAAAREVFAALVPAMAGRLRGARDQVFVRRPGYLSLEIAKRVPKRSR